jgi:transposase
VGCRKLRRYLGLSIGQLSLWRTEQSAAGSAAALAQRKAEEAETLRLKREVKRLVEEKTDSAQGRGGFRQGDRVTKLTFVSAERGNHAVATLCRVIGASVSGFYAWLHARRPEPSRDGGRSAAGISAYLCSTAAGLWLAQDIRRTAPGGPVARQAAHRAVDA